MHTRRRYVRHQVTLPAVDYRVFVLAVRILRQVMGRKAPTVRGLIRQNLTERSSNSVADDYLEWVGWPGGRVRRLEPKRSSISVHQVQVVHVPKLYASRGSRPIDSSRN